MPSSDALNYQATNPQSLYNAHYYDHYHSASGVPYGHREPWLTFFGTLADSIVRDIHPATVLDVGCAKGLLVEALRDRGVEAFGFDISPYAISQVREDIRSACWVSSVLDPFPRRYSLIVCIEVLEHLTKADAESAVGALCKHADDILFSSSPDQHFDETHLNVQPVEYWAELFAQYGFYRDVEFDASFIAPHAARFRGAVGPFPSVVRSYERKLWALLQAGQAQEQLSTELAQVKQRVERQLAEARQEQEQLSDRLREAAQREEQLRRQVQEHGATIEQLQSLLEEQGEQLSARISELEEIQSCLGWQLLFRYNTLKDRCLPAGSRRRAWYLLAVKSLKAGLNPGYAVLLQQALDTEYRKIHSALHPTVNGTGRGLLLRGTPGSPSGGRVLIITGGLGDTARYRCDYAQEQLELYGFRCQVRMWSDGDLQTIVPDYHLIILHRVPYYEPVQELVRIAHAHHRFVLFDTDDLVFEPGILSKIDALHYMDEAERALFSDGVRLYRQTLNICDGALVSTEALARAVANAGKPAWVHRNALSLGLLRISEEASRNTVRPPDDKVIIGYASGTRTHNRDFHEVEEALQRILAAYPQVEVWLIGHLDLNAGWSLWKDRVRRIPFMPWLELPKILAQLDINLAPLELGNPFCEGKSELKYFEAAAVGVPTVASKTGAFEVAIRHGRNGLLAEHSEDWFQALEQLVTNPTLRLEMGARARAHAWQRYHPATRGAELLATLHQAIEQLSSGLPDRSSPFATQVPQQIFKEHALAHTLLDGLVGLEIGAAAHNPFGLLTRNVAPPEDYEFYSETQRRDMGVRPAPVHIWASAGDIPVPDVSEDFIISSHVVEHLPDVIAAFMEWDRIVKDGGYILMIVPLKGALPADGPRPLTTLSHFVEDYQRGMTRMRALVRSVWRLVYRLDGGLLGRIEAPERVLGAHAFYRFLRSRVLYGRFGLTQLLQHVMPWDTHPLDGVPGGRMGHYHTFTPDSLLEVAEWMRHHQLCDWTLVAREDIDSKVGNGFTLAFQVKHASSPTRPTDPLVGG